MNSEFRSMDAECSKQQRNFDATHDPNARVNLATGSADWCLLNMREVHLALVGTSAEFWRQYRTWFGQPAINSVESEIEDQVREARFYAGGRVAFLAVESLAAAILAVMFFNAPPLIGAVIGIVLALLLGAAAAAGVARWIRHDAALQPTRQLARVSRGLLWCVIPWLISVVAALSVLRSEASSLGAALFLAMTTAVTLLSPLCSGLCAYAADLLFWSRRLCAELRWLRALGRRIHHLNDVIVQTLPPEPPTRKVPQDHQLLRLTKSAAPLLIISAVVWAGNLRAAEVPVYIYPDVSPSIRSAEVVQVLQGLSLRLEQYEGPDTLVVVLTPFYEDAYSASPIVKIRIAPVTTPKCEGALPQSEMARLSKVYAEASRRSASAKCEADIKQARAEGVRQRKAEITRLNAAIMRLAEIKLKGRCTAVNAMLRRAAREVPAGTSILISDLENDCPPMTLPANMVPINRLFVVAVGSHTRPVEQWFDSAQSRFASVMPKVRLLESFSLDQIFPNVPGNGTEIATR